jgi:hypothetical protein
MTIWNDRIVSCRLPDALKSEVENFSKENNISISSVIRLSLVLTLDRDKFLEKVLEAKIYPKSNFNSPDTSLLLKPSSAKT